MKKIYTSTRNKNIKATDWEAILNGLANDGGLYVFDHLKACELPLLNMMNMDYMGMAEVICSELLPSYTKEQIKQCVVKAYGSPFQSTDITPLNQVGDHYILELFHGPTCAFKDIGLQMLPQLMQVILQQEQKKQVMILTATSGDTGKAALKGFQDVDNIAITIFYPDGKVSDMQRLQMITQEGSNVGVCAIKGNFDDAQSTVKEMFNDEGMNRRIQDAGIYLSSANSINIGRLIPQIVYYFYAYKKMVEQKQIKFGECIDFCVPTGNFGNVLAGYYAKMMGLPVHKFIIASNENNVLYDFFQTGVYNKERPFHKTISPSMDILLSSNLERLLYYVSELDATYIQQIMNELKDTGRYEIKREIFDVLKDEFYAGFTTDKETKECIKDVYNRYGYVMDPHTAVGFKVMKEYQLKNKEHKCVLLSTASPYKFANEVYDAIFQKGIQGDEFALMEALSKKTNTSIPHTLSNIKDLKQRHHDVIDKKEMKEYVNKKTRELLK